MFAGAGSLSSARMGAVLLGALILVGTRVPQALAAAPARPTGVALSMGAMGLRGSWKARQLFQRQPASGAFALEATYDIHKGQEGQERGPEVAVGLGGFFEDEENLEVGGYTQPTTLKTYSPYLTGLVRWPMGARFSPYLALSGGLAFARAELGGRPLVDWSTSLFGRAALGLRVVVASRGALQVAVGAEAGMIFGTPFDFSVAPARPDADEREEPIFSAPVHLGELPNLRGYGGLNLVLSF